VPLEHEAARESRIHHRAVLHLVHARALAAPEVVVMLLARGLVSRWLAWDLDDLEPLLVHESLDRAVDGRDAKPWRPRHGCVEHLTRGQRTTRLQKHRSDRLALPGLSFHAVRHLSRGHSIPEACTRPRGHQHERARPDERRFPDLRQRDPSSRAGVDAGSAGVGAASALDPKTAALGHIAVAALPLVSGIPFHVTHASRSLIFRPRRPSDHSRGCGVPGRRAWPRVHRVR
jgi:hypothetical protein